VTNYADGKNLFLSNANWESDLQSGKGWSYGIEWQADRRTDKWQWHLAYTLSWNWRKFSTINNGVKFPFKYDRRHDLNISSTYFLNKTWSFTAQWFFATGDVYTLPNQGYPDFDNGQQITDPLQPGEYRLIYYSSAVNQYRTLPYHRLDVAATYRCLLFRKLSSRFTAGAYNIYGSPNQYVYDLEGTMGKRSLIVTTRYQRFSVTPLYSLYRFFLTCTQTTTHIILLLLRSVSASQGIARGRQDAAVPIIPRNVSACRRPACAGSRTLRFNVVAPVVVVFTDSL
jgi:hypothetical protein